MRADESFPNCLPVSRQLPARIGRDPLRFNITVADDLEESGARAKSIRLSIHFGNMAVTDSVEVKLNGKELFCMNPKVPGAYDPRNTTWQNYDLMNDPPKRGRNEVYIRLVRRDDRLEKELPIQIEDMELEIQYCYPNGPWVEPPGFIPRT